MMRRESRLVIAICLCTITSIALQGAGASPLSSVAVPAAGTEQVNEAERSFADLQDDKAQPAQWALAAETLTRATDVSFMTVSMFGGTWTAVPSRKPGEKIPLVGEPLRGRTAPSVADLLSRRLKEMMAGSDDDVSRNLRSAATFVDALMAWEPKNHLEEVRAYSAALLARYAADKNARPYLAGLIARFTALRMDLGDEQVAGEYSQWIIATDPSEVEMGVQTVFVPLWEHPERPDFAAAAEKLFADPKSLWQVIPVDPAHGRGYVPQLIGNPAMMIPALRKQILAAFDNKAPGGTITVTSRGTLVRADSPNIRSTGALLQKDDPRLPPVDVAQNYRACDRMAEELMRIDGFPRIELYWPEGQRDEILGIDRDILTRYGARLAREDRNFVSERFRVVRPVAFAFDPLDHPATAEDVAKGLAIFSLQGPQRRVWKMPAFPVKATWENLRAIPTTAVRFDPVTRTSERLTVWRQEGYIWQAEEVFTNGKWERWFGFVGPGFIGKVPASEVVLGSRQMTRGLLWTLEAPKAPLQASAQFGSLPAIPAGEPIPFHLHVHNVLGVAQDVPRDWYRNGALREGIILHVQKVIDEQKAGEFYEARVSDGWTDVLLKAGGDSIGHFKSDAVQRLEAAEELPITTIDLAPLGLTEAGLYRVWLAQEGEGTTMQPILLRIVAPAAPK